MSFLEQILENFVINEHGTYQPKAPKSMSTPSFEKVSPNLVKATISAFADRPDGPHTINLFINHHPDVPVGYFDMDYFGSGEIYCNLRSVDITAVKSSMSSLYSSYLSNPSSDLSTPPPFSGYTSKSISFATSVPSLNYSDLLSWRFPLNIFFYYNSVQQSLPMCIHYTYSPSNSTPVHISPNYKYSNLVEDYPTCSHSCHSSSKPVLCSFSSSDFSSCSLYSPSKKTILSQTITPSNSSDSLIFDLDYFITTDASHVFSITNKNTNQEVNTLTYPSSHSYQEYEEEAIRIYNMYLNSYSDTEFTFSLNQISSSEQDSHSPKQSYIASLLVG